MNYDLSGAAFVFPPKEGSSSDGITPSAKRESCIYLIFPTIATLHPTQLITEFTITTSSLADIASTFEATAHLIPQIDIELSALGGIASASLFVNLDALTDFTASTTSVANPQLCVTASTDINVGVGAEGSFSASLTNL